MQSKAVELLFCSFHQFTVSVKLLHLLCRIYDSFLWEYKLFRVHDCKTLEKWVVYSICKNLIDIKLLKLTKRRRSFRNIKRRKISTPFVWEVKLLRIFRAEFSLQCFFISVVPSHWINFVNKSQPISGIPR